MKKGKKILLSILAFLVLIGVVGAATWDGHYREALEPGDAIDTAALSGTTWKLATVKEGWFTRTSEAELVERSYAIYWAVFAEDGTVTLSYAPERGALDTELTYHGEDNWLWFDDGSMMDRKMKLSDGKLFFLDGVGVKEVFILEKQ